MKLNHLTSNKFYDLKQHPSIQKLSSHTNFTEAKERRNSNKNTQRFGPTSPKRLVQARAAFEYLRSSRMGHQGNYLDMTATHTQESSIPCNKPLLPKKAQPNPMVIKEGKTTTTFSSLVKFDMNSPPIYSKNS